jgi:hypothetical protein
MGSMAGACALRTIIVARLARVHVGGVRPRTGSLHCALPKLLHSACCTGMCSTRLADTVNGIAQTSVS